MYTRIINRAIQSSLVGIKGNTDFQRQRSYDFHAKEFKNEKAVSVEVAHKITSMLDDAWSFETIGLYPEKWKAWEGEGWTLAKNKGAIQLHPALRTISYLCHEHAHVVVESYRTYYRGGQHLLDKGHGPLWCGVFAYDLSVIIEVPCVDIIEKMRYHGLRVVDEPTITFLREIIK